MDRLLAAGALLAAVAAPASGQTGDPLINEFVANHTGTDVNEFIEVFGTPDTDYGAYSILAVEGDAGSSPGVVDAVFPVGRSDAGGFWTTGFLRSRLENGTVSLLLVDRFSGSVGDDLDADDDGALDPFPPWQRLADAVAVADGGGSDLAYADVVLSPDFDGGDTTPGGAARLPDGRNTGTTEDWLRSDFEGDGLPAFPDAPPAASGEAVNTPGTANRAGFTPPPPPPPPGLIINEVDADTPGIDGREFIELYDGGTGHTSLDDLVVVLYNGATDRSYRAYDLDGFHTNAEGFFVMGNDGVIPTPSLVFPEATLQNGADAVALFAGDGSDFPDGTPVTTGFLVDALVYDTDDDDDPGLLALLHAGEPQVNENGNGDREAASVQRLPNGAGGRRTTQTYAPFFPTPGSVNGGADVSLTMQVAALRKTGATTTALFALTLANDGPAAATGLEVTDHLPEGMTFLSASASQGDYGPDTGLWQVGTLLPGRTALLHLTVSADAHTPFFNVAEVTAVNEPDPDSFPGDGRGDDLGVAALGRSRPDLDRFQADLHLTVAAVPATVNIGEAVTFTLAVTNDGPMSTAGVGVACPLPDGLTYAAAAGDGTYDEDGGRWKVGRLRAGATAMLALTATATSGGTFTLTAEVTAGHLPDPDSEADNGDPNEDDRSEAVVTVQEAGAGAPGAEGNTTFVSPAFELGLNYPNPLRAATVLPFEIPEATHVNLTVYDGLGRAVEVLVDRPMPAGLHTVRWRASSYPSGLYIARLRAKGELKTRRLILVK